MQSQPIDTPRMQLRPLTVADVTQTYVDWLNDPEINRYLEVRFTSHTLETVRGFVGQMAGDPDNLLVGMFLKDDGRHIGNLKLGPINRHHRRAEIGLLIGDRSQWGKGLAAEAIKALSDHALGPLGLRKVLAGCYRGNEGSLRAFLKVGFSQVGCLQDHWWCGDHWEDELLMERLA